MAASGRPTVDSIISGLDPIRREVMKSLRNLVKKAVPAAVEAVKWNQPVYVYKGKNLIAFMVFEDHINYGIFVGSKLQSTRLEGTGKGLRHVKVSKLSDIDEKEFSRLAKEASALVR
jgi:hypothetical protein